tara:strand:+ start:324 stop:605 length:282 start_codon:yes stop_codon:yes gene_type:complete
MSNQNNVDDANSLASLLANLYAETFTSTPANPNSPINNSQHLRRDLTLADAVKIRQRAITGFTYIWGGGGTSDECATGTANVSVRWGYTGLYA